MRDTWSDDVLAGAPRPDEQFRSSLRERILNMWDDDLTVPGVSTARRPRRWTVVAAAAVVVLGMAGFLVLRSGGTSGTPSSPGPTPSPATTEASVVGTWVVTGSNGMPLPSPLPTFHFKLGTSAVGRGLVTGFDGCRAVTGTWSVDAGRFAISLEDDRAPGCASPGATAPLVPLTDALMTEVDGRQVMRFGEAGDTVARRVDDLPVPAALTGESWLLPIGGPDLTLAFATTELTVTADATVCARTSYGYDDSILRIGAIADRSTSTPCASSLPPGLEDTAIDVVEFSDQHGASLLFITPTAGTQRVYPAAAGHATAEAADTTGAPAVSGSTAAEPVPLVLPASSGMTLENARQGTLGDSNPIRWYTAAGAKPENGTYLRVISGTHPVPSGHPLGCVIGGPIGSTRDEMLADGTPVCLTVRPSVEAYGRLAVDRSPTSIVVEGNATDDELLTAAAHLTPSPSGGYEIDPAGWPADVTEVEIGVGVSDFATASLAAAERSMIQAGWSDASGRAFFYVATADERASAAMRLNFATVVDTNLRGEPGFLRTLPDQPAYLGAVWHHEGTTYQVGSQGLTEQELRELLDQLHVPTAGEWVDLLAGLDATARVTTAPTTS